MSRTHPITGKFLCEWGDKAFTEDDQVLCTQQAVGIVAIADGGGKFIQIKCCPIHRQLLVDETGEVGA